MVDLADEQRVAAAIGQVGPIRIPFENRDVDQACGGCRGADLGQSLLVDIGAEHTACRA